MIKLAVFDLDGTLINSLEDLADAVNKGLEYMGYPVRTIEEYRMFVGNGALKLCERALPENAKDKTEELWKKFSENYDKNSTVKTRPYNGIETVLSELKSHGVKLAVATNKPHKFSVDIVKHFFGDSFDIIIGNSNLRPKKPNPQIIYDIMEETGVFADETVMIGDSDVDILTAKNSGIKSIGCTWGFRDRALLEECGADYIIEKPIELIKIVLS